METLRIALCQINTTIGDLDGNVRNIISGMRRAARAGADIVTFPELAIPGYPPEDLCLRPRFIDDNRAALDKIIEASGPAVTVVGFIDRQDDIYNAAAVIQRGQLLGVYHKQRLPNYGVFDENRYFKTGDAATLLQLGDVTIGLSICEDIWYPGGVIDQQVCHGGAQVILNISASPYQAGKCLARERMLATRAMDHVAALAFTNMSGGQDELVFDGTSCIIDSKGQTTARCKQFGDDFLVADLDLEAVFRHRLADTRLRHGISADDGYPLLDVITAEPRQRRVLKPLPKKPMATMLDSLDEIYQALVLGTGDYIRKNDFSTVVIGASGGIDSALTAAIAVDALGADNVVLVTMPSKYSSKGTRSDAEQLANNLGARFLEVPIHDLFLHYKDILSSVTKEKQEGVAWENLQARIRGNILMTLSNAFGWLVLTTGNKSETSVGYSTLYGDTAGGFAVIKDVAKTLVYELSQYRNEREGRELIPDSTITRPPTAELRPGQKDTDSLPPYDVLDPILQGYVEEDLALSDLVRNGFDGKTVQHVLRLVDLNEYKRRQSPIGLKITAKAFGKDRRLPITNRYRSQ